MRVIAVPRAAAFSPGRHAENDRLILELVVRELGRRGVGVVWVPEEALAATPLPPGPVISMCQGPAGIRALVREERRGRLVVNSAAAVARCYRENLYRRLGDLASLFPPTAVVETGAPDFAAAPWAEDAPVWVKRGDVHAVSADDVRLAAGPGEVRRLLAGLARRGIRHAALQRHVEGRVVKFYGVADSGFFRHYCEDDAAVSPLALGAFRPRIEALMAAVGLDIYGGDVVIDRRGRIYVIDVNDWPSFASFREPAARAIAARILRRLAAHGTPSRVARYP